MEVVTEVAATATVEDGAAGGNVAAAARPIAVERFHPTPFLSLSSA